MAAPPSSLRVLAPGVLSAEEASLLPVALKERAGIVPASAPYSSLLDPDLTREEVLERIDPETLKTAPLNLLVSTAISIAPPDACAATEDAVLRYSAALSSEIEGAEAYIRITAEKLVLADVEYQQAISAYAAADAQTPTSDTWRNPQHYLEALKIHERRMDRLLRARKDAFERYERAAEVYRTAVLTAQGQEILTKLGRRRSASVPEVLPAQGKETANVLIVVR